ncbi:hypothetical protein JVU11DRAFT_11771 [Chiua virens]|nr:hypothetical protein JVU11DRAFT_11771 [Chiua virens]
MSQALTLKSSTPTCSPTSSLMYCDTQSDSMGSDLYSFPGKESNHSFPCPKYPGPWTNPSYKHSHAILLQHHGGCDESLVDCKLGLLKAWENFCYDIQALPDRALHFVIFNKYMLAKKSHLQLLIATWDLEVMKCRVFMQQEALYHLEATHCLNELELKHWLSLYTD